MNKIDEKNCLILNRLQKNCRASLTSISKEVNLSVDSVKKRIDKMINEGVFYPTIQLRPRQFGYPYIVDVKIKLHNYNNTKIKEFITYSMKHPRIVEIFSISGEWDFTIVIIAKDHEDLAMLSSELRKKFGEIIGGWSESLTTIAYKFEEYNLTKLKKYESNLI